MKSYTIVIERCPQTNLYVGSVPGFPGAHSQAETLDELRNNMREGSPCCWKMAKDRWVTSLGLQRICTTNE